MALLGKRTQREHEQIIALQNKFGIRDADVAIFKAEKLVKKQGLDEDPVTIARARLRVAAETARVKSLKK